VPWGARFLAPAILAEVKYFAYTRKTRIGIVKAIALSPANDPHFICND
jgi:hypothetical protein